MMTQDEVRELFDYDANDGMLRWRNRARGRTVGSIAGHVNASGYRKIMLWRNDRNVACYAHRLIWLWVHGEEPKNEIDHVNMNRDDNRLVNLRLATRSENRRNTRVRSDSGIGFKGVGTKGKRWSARIQVGGVTKYLGTFDTPKLAHAAYCEAAKLIHGEFARSA